MAVTDRDILITPNVGQSGDPTIAFTGADSNVGPKTLTLTTTPGANGTLLVKNSSNQVVFQISNRLTGEVFNVATAGGASLLAARDTGQVAVGAGGFGYMRYPRCPAFRVRNSNSSGAFSANAQATWNTLDYNNGGYFANNRFTAPWSGVYFFSAQMLSENNTRLFFNFRVNGSDVSGTFIETYSGSNYQTGNSFMTYYLRQADYVDVYVRSNSAYASLYANFSGMQVG